MYYLKLTVKFALLFLLTSCGNVIGDFVKENSFVEPYVAYTNQKNTVGMNVWFLSDWDGSRAFVDAMKHARPWESNVKNATLKVDEWGWPLEDANTVVISAMYPEIDNGNYTLVFEGQATVGLNWVGGKCTKTSYDESTNTSVWNIFVDSQLGSHGERPVINISLSDSYLTKTSPKNSGFKNVRMYRPGYLPSTTQVFITPLINALSQTGVIRTMDWMATNANVLTNWADRTTPLHAIQGRNAPDYQVTQPSSFTLQNCKYGISLEHIIQLSNETMCDLWINVPVLASDDYVKKMAQLILYGSDGKNPYTAYEANPVYAPLNPQLKVYVEYGNEVWNSANGFWCFYILQDRILKLESSHPIFSDANKNQYQCISKYVGYRLAEISKVLRGVFGDAQMMSKVRPILSTQLGNANETLSLPLIWAQSYYPKMEGHPLNYYYYGAGGSAYYGVKTLSNNFSQFLARTNYPDPIFVKFNTLDSVWAYTYGLKRVAYEGGFGLDYPGVAGNYFFTTSEMWAIANDPRTQKLMEIMQICWDQTGGDVLVYYCITGPSPWGMTPHLFDLNKAKYNAFKNITNSNKARVTIGSLLPGQLIVTDIYPENEGKYIVRTGFGYYNTVDNKSVLDGNDEGESLSLPAHSESAFTGTLTLTGNRWNAGTSTIAVSINGEKVGVIKLDYSTGLTKSSTLKVSIPEGLAVIRLDAESGNYSLYSLEVLAD